MATTDTAETPQDGSQPGVLGDGTQAQDLGQPGHPENRVTEADVDAAFAADPDAKDAAKAKP